MKVESDFHKWAYFINAMMIRCIVLEKKKVRKTTVPFFNMRRKSSIIPKYPQIPQYTLTNLNFPNFPNYPNYYKSRVRIMIDIKMKKEIVV